MVALIQPRHDDVAALDQPDARARVDAQLAQHLRHPRPRRVDQRPRGHLAPVRQPRRPQAVLAPGALQGGARQHLRPVRRRVDRVQQRQARIVDIGVRIDEPTSPVLQRRDIGRVRAPEPARARQRRSPAQPVIEQQAGAHQPPGTDRVGMRQHEAHRPDQVRPRLHQPLALAKRMRHEAEVVIFQIAQPAMNQLGRSGRGMLRQVVALHQQHAPPVQRRLARDRASIDAAADDQQVVYRAGRHEA